MSERDDPFNDFFDRDPEFVDGAERLEPAKPKTKQALYDLVQAKVGQLPDKAFLKSRRFKDPAGGAIITAALLRTGTRRNTDKLATVTTEGADQTDTRLQVKISIIDSPDGLQLSKRVTTIDNNDRIVGGFAVGQSAALFSGAGRFDPATLRAKQEAEAMENQLGLTFVSEVEAATCIAMLESAQPYER